MGQNLSQKNESQSALEPLAVGIEGLRALLGGIEISPVTAWRWEKRRLIERVPGVSQRLWTVASIKRLVAGGGK
jgi:hypothetical protein